jgi:hypothetical protein
MSTAAVSSSSLFQEFQAYFQQRGSDSQQLGQALQAGDLADAQQDYNAIQTLAQSGPFANGAAFAVSARQQDFAAVGQALQAGDLAGAQQAFAQLQSTFQRAPHGQPAEAQPLEVVINLGSAPAASSTGAAANASALPAAQTASAATPAASPSTTASGPEIVLNLGNVTAGEQITIGVNETSNGAEQLTLSVANQQNQNPEQITLNLNQNSNEQIILNLFNSSTSTSAQGNVSVTA